MKKVVGGAQTTGVDDSDAVGAGLGGFEVKDAADVAAQGFFGFDLAAVGGGDEQVFQAQGEVVEIKQIVGDGGVNRDPFGLIEIGRASCRERV